MDERWEKVRKLWEIIDDLRGEPGCPWDRKQTPESVQTYLIEEAHEAASAIRSGEAADAAEELGDLLFMVLFLVHIYEEQGSFGLEDVADLICRKMIRRHPHVFGDVAVSSTKEVKENWEKIKAAEKASSGKTSGEIPESLPALMRAYRMISRMASKEGSPWNDLEARTQDFAKQSERLTQELACGGHAPSEVFGELLLSLVNLARIEGRRPEDCLHTKLASLNGNGKVDE